VSQEVWIVVGCEYDKPFGKIVRSWAEPLRFASYKEADEFRLKRDLRQPKLRQRSGDLIWIEFYVDKFTPD
jgi:hypothetical protein